MNDMPSNRVDASHGDMPADRASHDGGCTCGRVRYRLLGAPLIVHACHCHWCQRETGSAFALNAMIESDRVQGLGEPPVRVVTPSESGRGQWIARCGHCRVAVWSHYAGSGPVFAFVRVGTLDEPERLPPDAHIFTASRQRWLPLPADAPAFEVFYERESLWLPQSLRRREAVLAQVAQWQAACARQPSGLAPWPDS